MSLSDLEKWWSDDLVLCFFGEVPAAPSSSTNDMERNGGDVDSVVPDWYMAGGKWRLCNVMKEEFLSQGVDPKYQSKGQDGKDILYLVAPVEPDDPARRTMRDYAEKLDFTDKLIPVYQEDHVVEATAETFLRKRPIHTIGEELFLNDHLAKLLRILPVTKKKKMLELTCRLRYSRVLNWMQQHLKKEMGDILPLYDLVRFVVHGEQASYLTPEQLVEAPHLVALAKRELYRSLLVLKRWGEIGDNSNGYNTLMDYKDNFDRAPEHVACLRGDYIMLEVALSTKEEAKVATRGITYCFRADVYDETAFHGLARKRHAELLLPLFEELMKRRVLSLDDFDQVNHQGMTALDMCQDDPPTLKALQMFRSKLENWSWMDGHDEEDEPVPMMTRDEFKQWVKSQEENFVRMCLTESTKINELERYLVSFRTQIANPRRSDFKSVLSDLKEKSCLACLYPTRIKALVLPSKLWTLPGKLPFPRFGATEQALYMKSDPTTIQMDFDFRVGDYKFASKSLMECLACVGDYDKLKWILSKFDSKPKTKSLRAILKTLIRFGHMKTFVKLMSHFREPSSHNLQNLSVEYLSVDIYRYLTTKHDTRIPDPPKPDHGSVMKLSESKILESATSSPKVMWKLEKLARCRLPILKIMLESNPTLDSKMTYETLCIDCLSKLQSSRSTTDVPVEPEFLKFLLQHEGTADSFLTTIERTRAEDLKRMPKWLTKDIIPAEEKKRLIRRQTKLALKMQPLLRGFLTRRQIMKRNADLGHWYPVLLNVQDLKASNNVEFNSWIQLKLDNTAVVESDEFRILEEAALATQGDDNDFGEEDYEEGEPAFPDAVLEDENKVVCKIQFTSGVISWWKKVKDEKYLEMFWKRVDSLARGGESYCLSKRLKGSKQGAFETKLDKGMRIIWTQRGDERMIWFVCKHKAIARCVELVDLSYERVVKSKVNYGKQEWEELDDIDNAEPEMLAAPESNTPLKIHTVTVDMLAESWNDMKWVPPLKLTKAEEAIVSRHGTTLLLGRSGTGKTLCVCNRMARDRSIFEDKCIPLKQLFVARTRRLCEYVKDLQTREQFKSNIEHATFEPISDYVQSLSEEFREEDGNKTARQNRWVRGKFVDFPRFRDEIWDEVKGDAKNREILLMWTQIRSFIKGSFEAVDKKRPLEEQEYMDLPKNRCRVDEEERRRAYGVYLRYQQCLMSKGGLWDELDRVLHVAHQFKGRIETEKRETGVVPQRFQRVYVDEVQDMTQAELTLLFYSTGEDVDAMFFAGDNAQSVSEGVDFRFEEVRSLVNLITDGAKKIQKPERLVRNFRSHEGILRVSNLMLDRMYQAFPKSVTRLATDMGLVQGPRPGIIFGVTKEDIAETLASNDRLRALVRDEHKELMEAELNSSDQIIGIREAKGLEFREVVIVNFFTHIKDKAHHRAWKALLGTDNGIDSAQIPVTMELELKLLYTAITRSIDRLFFVETENPQSFVAWQRCLVDKDLGTIMRMEDTKSDRGMMTADDYRIEGIERATLAIDDEYGPAIDKLNRAIRSFVKAGDKDLEDKARAHVKALKYFHESVLANNDNTGSSNQKHHHPSKAMNEYLKAGLVDEALRVCRNYCPNIGFRNYLTEMLKDIVRSAPTTKTRLCEA